MMPISQWLEAGTVQKSCESCAWVDHLAPSKRLETLGEGGVICGARLSFLNDRRGRGYCDWWMPVERRVLKVAVNQRALFR